MINYAYSRDLDWGEFVWSKANLGTRRSELCALRWEHLELDPARAVVQIREALYKDDDGSWKVKDTKTHQQRRIVPDIETILMLTERRERKTTEAALLNIDLSPKAIVFSTVPDGLTPLNPDTVTQRYERMAHRLGIVTALKQLRHYNATELVAGGVDPRTVGGRLGHSGGGTTLKVYAAWSDEADQRAAAGAHVRMPPQPGATTEETAETVAALPSPKPAGPYQQIAGDLRGAIAIGVLRPGDAIPTEKDFADRYKVARSTAHRAVAELAAAGLVTVSRGVRAKVASELPADQNE